MNLKSQALLMTGCLASPAFAVPGFLDPTFGENGQVLVELPGPSRGWSGAQQEDGKLVIVGSAIVETGDFALLRLNPDGTLDSTFGVNGVATVDFNGAEDQAVEVLIQDDGKLVAAGYSWVDNYDFALARFNADGSIDTTFGTNGRATFNPGGFDDRAYGAVLLEDGRIVVAGVTDVREHYDVMLVRFNGDGSLDRTFGSNGSVLIDAGAEDQAYWLVAQPDGKLIACGLSGPYAYSGFEGRMLAVRVHADGAVDAAYGINGIATVDTGTDFGVALGCTMQLDGKAVLAGYTGSEPAGGPAGDLNLALARLDGDGIPDTTFGTGGQSHLDLENLGQDDIGRHVVALTDGKLGVTGAIGQLAYIARVNADGSLDTGFSFDGVLKYGFCHCEMPSAFGWRLLEQSDGKLVATGTSFGDSPGAFAIARANTGDDQPPAVLEFTGGVVGVFEGGSFLLNVARTGPASGAVSVDFATSSGTATAGSDFTSASGTLHWADGDSASQTISVQTIDDTADEGDETLTVTLANPSAGATLGSNSSVPLTIEDNDPSGGGGEVQPPPASPPPASPPPSASPTPPSTSQQSGGGGSSDGLLLGLLLVGLALKAQAPFRSREAFHQRRERLMSPVKFSALSSALLCLAVSPRLLAGDYSGSAMAATYESIDCPDSLFTEASAINDRGDIVGTCEDANGVHGFRLRKGVLSLIDVPDAPQTFAAGTNNLGHVVGFYGEHGAKHGYVLRNGRFTTIDPPGSVETFAYGIDDLGRIVGFYRRRDGSIPGFILDSGRFRDVVVPQAVATGAWAINVLRRIAGGFVDADGIPHGFYFKSGNFTTIHPPDAVGARAFGVNVLGHIVGGWTDDPDCPDCFVYAFLFNSRGYRNLRFPGADETVARGINTVGQIVGSYLGVDGQFHGFVRDPRAPASPR